MLSVAVVSAEVGPASAGMPTAVTASAMSPATVGAGRHNHRKHEA